MRNITGNVLMAGGSQLLALAVASMTGTVLCGALVLVVGLYFGFALTRK